MKHERTIGLAEAAQRLGVPYQTAHRLLLVGSLRGQKVGGRWYVRASDVRRLGLSRARQQQPQPAA